MPKELENLPFSEPTANNTEVEQQAGSYNESSEAEDTTSPSSEGERTSPPEQLDSIKREPAIRVRRSLGMFGH